MGRRRFSNSTGLLPARPSFPFVGTAVCILAIYVALWIWKGLGWLLSESVRILFTTTQLIHDTFPAIPSWGWTLMIVFGVPALIVIGVFLFAPKAKRNE